MNWGIWLLWGFVATLALTTTLSASQGLGLTRMGLPYLLGSMITADRDRARLYGFGIHAFNGWIFSLLYVLIFESVHHAAWWRGALIGLAHGTFLLVVGVSLLPGLHPRMASEQHGPTAARQLEPPGFMALNYGVRTPLSILAAHAVYGAILGAFYHVV